GRQDVERKGDDDQFAVANLVSDDAANDDAETEAGEAGPADVAQFGGGKSEFSSPVVEDAAANREAHAGGQDGHEAGPEKPFCVGGSAVCVSVAHNFVCRFGFSPK